MHVVAVTLQVRQQETTTAACIVLSVAHLIHAAHTPPPPSSLGPVWCLLQHTPSLSAPPPLCVCVCRLQDKDALPKGRLSSAYREGVLFVTYSLLAMGNQVPGVKQGPLAKALQVRGTGLGYYDSQGLDIKSCLYPVALPSAYISGYRVAC